MFALRFARVRAAFGFDRALRAFLRFAQRFDAARRGARGRRVGAAAARAQRGGSEQREHAGEHARRDRARRAPESGRAARLKLAQRLGIGQTLRVQYVGGRAHGCYDAENRTSDAFAGVV